MQQTTTEIPMEQFTFLPITNSSSGKKAIIKITETIKGKKMRILNNNFLGKPFIKDKVCKNITSMYAVNRIKKTACKKRFRETGTISR